MFIMQTNVSLRLETDENDDDANRTSVNLVTELNGLYNTTWTSEIIICLSIVSLLMLLTLLGNAVVIITIISCAELRKKRVNVFILNLAVGDLMVCCVAMPTYMLIVTFGQWELGDVTCKLAAYGFIAPVAFSILLLTAMSVERYQALISQPMKFFGGTRRVWCCVLISWLLAAIAAIPHSTVSVQTKNHSLPPNKSIYKCEGTGYAAEWQRKLYCAFLTVVLLIIPTCIMLFCYVNIIRVVWLRAGRQSAGNIDEPRVHFVTSRRSEPASGPAVWFAEVRNANHQKSSSQLPRCHSVGLPLNSHVAVDVPRRMTLTTKRSVIRMAISVTVGFMVCVTPAFVVTSVRVYSDYQYTWTAANVVSGLMALSHSAVNPFLYIIFSTRAVRAAFAHLSQRARPRCCDYR